MFDKIKKGLNIAMKHVSNLYANISGLSSIDKTV